MALGDTHRPCFAGRAAGGTGLGCWRNGERQRPREQFSEEVLIAGGEKLFHLRARECSQENQAGLEEGHRSAPHTNATVNYT